MPLLIDERCIQLGITVLPPQDTTHDHWVLTHLWLTENGNWDNVPDWAKVFQNDHLGGATHVYYTGFMIDGSHATDEDLFVVAWPDGHTFVSPKKEHNWWGNVIINAGFDWSKGNTGPYMGQVNALSTSCVHGLGLPYPPYPWRAESAKALPRRYWDGYTWVGSIEREIAGAIMGGLHTSFFLVFQETAGQPNGNGPQPPPGQLQRVLTKAEGVADKLADEGRGDWNLAKAGDLYVDIARVLKCRCGEHRCG
jgi:hypothetical protein